MTAISTIRRAALTLLTFTVAMGFASAHAQGKRRIAVIPFSVTGDASAKARQLGISDDMGVNLSDKLVDRLVKDGKYSLVERSQLDKIMKEQLLSNSDRFDTATAAKIGKIAGVSAIVIGSVTQFEGEENSTSTSGPIAIGRRYGVPTFGRKNSRVSVAITARLVDTNTATILASANGSGTSSKGSMTTSAETKTGNDIGSPMINGVMDQAIDEVAQALDNSSAADALPVIHNNYTGVVADVSGTTLTLTVGTTAGVRVGDIVQISHPGKTIYVPGTKEVLRVISDPLGKAKVTDVDERSAVATYSGTAPVQVNDKVSSTP